MPREDERFNESAWELYLNDLKFLPGLPTAEEETILFERIAQGDKQARDRLITSHLPFVIFIALRYKAQKWQLADLVQEGNIGLLKALKRFRGGQGARFRSYAQFCIRAEIRKYISDSRLIKFPGKLDAKWGRLRSAYIALYQELEREPTVPELAVKSGFSPYYAREYLFSRNEPLSLETVVGEHDREELTLRDVLRSQPITFPDGRTAEIVLEFLSALPVLDRQVMTMTYGLNEGDGQPMSAGEIASALGMKVKQIEHIKRRALRNLRHLPLG